MDTWFVGRQPIGFYKEASAKEQPGLKVDYIIKKAEKEVNKMFQVFFMKARVYAGQVKLNKDFVEFAWLTKDELVNYLSPEYYKSIKDCLSDI